MGGGVWINMSIWNKTIYNPYKNPEQYKMVTPPTVEEYDNMRLYLEKLHKKGGIKKKEL